MNWAVFDMAGLLLHLGGILFVVAFVLGYNFAFAPAGRELRRELVGNSVLSVAGTTIIYAFLFDSTLIQPFDTKGVLVILFGGNSIVTLIRLARGH